MEYTLKLGEIIHPYIGANSIKRLYLRHYAFYPKSTLMYIILNDWILISTFFIWLLDSFYLILIISKNMP